MAASAEEPRGSSGEPRAGIGGAPELSKGGSNGSPENRPENKQTNPVGWRQFSGEPTRSKNPMTPGGTPRHRKRTVWDWMVRLHQRCVGCVNHAPKGVLIALPDRSSCRAMKAELLSAFSPSGA